MCARACSCEFVDVRTNCIRNMRTNICIRAIHLQVAREEQEREERLREEQLELMRFGSRCLSPVCVCV